MTSNKQGNHLCFVILIKKSFLVDKKIKNNDFFTLENAAKDLCACVTRGGGVVLTI